jgi:uncharacterized protein (DUF4415 family)
MGFEWDNKKAKQGVVLKISPNKTRVTIRLDNDILNWFRNEVHKNGGGNYQTLINASLREFIESKSKRFESAIRKIIREELKVLSH